MHISDMEYQQLSQLIQNKFGISLGKNKKALVLTRLQALLTQQGIQSFGEYYHHVTTDPTGKALLTLANRITTNYSFFYREREHFDFLQRQGLPQRIAQPPAANGSSLHLWSAACSAGEEPYTLAMVLQDFFKTSSAQWDLGILATDIDTNMLGIAQRGIYPEDRLKGIPPLSRINYFQSTGQGMWQIKPEIRKWVHFSRFNLIQSAFTFQKKFFAIFCRNLLIYFDRPTANTLVRRFYEVTEEQGYLFISHTENLDKDNCPYRYVAPSIYQKV